MEVRGRGKYTMAFGVAHLPNISAFVQVWDHEDFDQPYDEGEDEDGNKHTNIVAYEGRGTLNGYPLSVERVVQLARQYDIPVDPHEVWKTFD